MFTKRRTQSLLVYSINRNGQLSRCQLEFSVDLRRVQKWTAMAPGRLTSVCAGDEWTQTYTVRGIRCQQFQQLLTFLTSSCHQYECVSMMRWSVHFSPPFPYHIRTPALCQQPSRWHNANDYLAKAFHDSQRQRSGQASFYSSCVALLTVRVSRPIPVQRSRVCCHIDVTNAEMTSTSARSVFRAFISLMRARVVRSLEAVLQRRESSSRSSDGALSAAFCKRSTVRGQFTMSAELQWTSDRLRGSRMC